VLQCVGGALPYAKALSILISEPDALSVLYCSGGRVTGHRQRDVHELQTP